MTFYFAHLLPSAPVCFAFRPLAAKVQIATAVRESSAQEQT